MGGRVGGVRARKKREGGREGCVPGVESRVRGLLGRDTRRDGLRYGRWWGRRSHWKEGGKEGREGE